MSDPLERIAAALERLAPSPVTPIDWHTAPGYVHAVSGTRAVTKIDAPALALLRGIDAQKEVVVTNVKRLAEGAAAHDMLLWGARGMGKSALLRAAFSAAQGEAASRLALVQVAADGLDGLPLLLEELRGIHRRFLVFIDDLGFEGGDVQGARVLRSWLEGGVEARPANVRLAVTSNRRAIVERHLSEQALFSEQEGPVNPRDAVDDRLALADRFGLSVGFHACSQDDYLAIVRGYAEAHGLAWDEADALNWSRRRGSRSGRVAWQFVVELAGRAGKSLG